MKSPAKKINANLMSALKNNKFFIYCRQELYKVVYKPELYVIFSVNEIIKLQTLPINDVKFRLVVI